MQIKEWLNRGWKITAEIKELEQEREKAFAQATGTTVSTEGERVQGGPLGNASEEKMVRYSEYSQKLDEAIERLDKVKAEILEAIETLEKSTYRTVLIKRYLRFQKWEQIALDMNYSYMQITRIHGKALKALRLKDVIEC